jgi:sporulation protein YlmC with PRC-barrel domain
MVLNSQARAENLAQVNRKSTINNLLTSLRTKVAHFDVIDNHGQLVGRVKDLILDNHRRLNLVISHPANSIKSGKQTEVAASFAFVWSQKIQRIDTINKSLFLNLNISEIEYMSELEPQIPGHDMLSDNSHEQLAHSDTTNGNLADISEENIIRLLEEKLVVESSIHKVGEVIIRKEIETRMIQVPVRREKLIVEQVSPEHKQLAEINLSSEELADIVLAEVDGTTVSNFVGDLTVTADFDSPKIASLLLNAIALEKNPGCQRVRVSIVCDDEAHKHKYQEWFDRCSKGQQPKSIS